MFNPYVACCLGFSARYCDIHTYYFFLSVYSSPEWQITRYLSSLFIFLFRTHRRCPPATAPSRRGRVFALLCPRRPHSSPSPLPTTTMAMSTPILTWSGRLHCRRNPNAALSQSPPSGRPVSDAALLRSPDLNQNRGRGRIWRRGKFECWVAPNHSSDL